MRNAPAALEQEGWNTSPPSVYRITTSGGLKWFKKKRIQKLRNNNNLESTYFFLFQQKIFYVSISKNSS